MSSTKFCDLYPANDESREKQDSLSTSMVSGSSVAVAAAVAVSVAVVLVLS